MGCYCINKNNLYQSIKKNDIDVNYSEDRHNISHNTNQNENVFQSYSSKIIKIEKKNIKYDNINTEVKNGTKTIIKQTSKEESFDAKVKTKRKSKCESAKKLIQPVAKNTPQKSSFSQNNIHYKPILSYLEKRAKEREKSKSNDKTIN